MKQCIIFLVFFAILGSNAASSQSFFAAKRERTIIFTGGLGTSTYLGDLANSNVYIAAQPNINAGLEYYVTNRIGVRAEFNWFTLAGDDKNADLASGRDQRNLSFQSSNFELSAVGIVNLFAHGDRYYRRPGINVYGFAGIGLLYFNPKAKDAQGNLVALQPLKTEGVSYSLLTPVIPYGLGVRLKVTPQFNISIEGGIRKAFTDYLDDVSTRYPGTSTFSDPVAAYFSDRRTDPAKVGTAGDKRGDPSNSDSYMLLNAKIEYYLPLSFGGNQRKKSYSNKRKSFSRYKKGGKLKR